MAEHDGHDLSEAARRGLRRAGVHLVKAAIEVVAGVGALLEEIKGARPDDGGDGGERRQRIDLD